MYYNFQLMGIGSKWQAALSRSRNSSFGWLNTLFVKPEVSANTWLDLEEQLIKADFGIATTNIILEKIQSECRIQRITKSNDLKRILKQELQATLDYPKKLVALPNPCVTMLVGVNGSGKTTTIAKLGHLASKQRKVLFIGADTYRAAAADQLSIWAKRLDIPLISGQEGSDPGAIVFDGIQHAISHTFDFVLIDTAGRLHTKYNLMEELKKIQRVAGKAFPGAPHETWLVLDATTGQNALMQARVFYNSINVTGVILTKLDSSSKGGMVFAIKKELNIPILYAGLGEKADDLSEFNPDYFINGILGY